MALDFIESHRQKYFFAAHCLIARDTKNSLVLTKKRVKRFFGSLDELALILKPDIK